MKNKLTSNSCRKKTFATRLLASLAIAGMAGFSACSSLPDIPTGPVGYKPVAASLKSEPDWINNTGEWASEHSKKTGDVWFVASSPMENSLQGAKHDAYIRAQRKASDRIGDQNWNIVGNSVKRAANNNTQVVDTVEKKTKTKLRQMSQGWLVGGQEWQYYWIEYQPKKDFSTRVPGNERSLYRVWALVKYSHNNWECSRRNSLKMLPMIANNMGGKFGYHNFDSNKFRSVLEDITNKNLSLIPDNVCSGDGA